jgi:hypothetical protein
MRHASAVGPMIMLLASAALAAITTGYPIAAALLAAVLARYVWSVSGAGARLARAVQPRSGRRRRNRKR